VYPTVNQHNGRLTKIKHHVQTNAINYRDNTHTHIQTYMLIKSYMKKKQLHNAA